MDRSAIARRFVLPPVIIVAVFFFLERSKPFTDVWKPILLYCAIAIPAFILLDRVRARARTE